MNSTVFVEIFISEKWAFFCTWQSPDDCYLVEHLLHLIGNLAQHLLHWITVTPWWTGLEKVPISPWLVTLLHICGVIPTLQSPTSLETPRRCCRKLSASADVSASSADVSASSTDIVTFNGECCVMFHNVLRVIHNVSQCFTSVSWCFTMFNNVLRSLVSRATIGIAALATTQASLEKSYCQQT